MCCLYSVGIGSIGWKEQYGYPRDNVFGQTEDFNLKKINIHIYVMLNSCILNVDEHAEDIR